MAIKHPMKMMSGFREKFRAGDKNLGVTHIYLVFKAMGLDEISMGVGGGEGEDKEGRVGGRQRERASEHGCMHKYSD